MKKLLKIFFIAIMMAGLSACAGRNFIQVQKMVPVATIQQTPAQLSTTLIDKPRK